MKLLKDGEVDSYSAFAACHGLLTMDYGLSFGSRLLFSMESAVATACPDFFSGLG